MTLSIEQISALTAAFRTLCYSAEETSPYIVPPVFKLQDERFILWGRKKGSLIIADTRDWSLKTPSELGDLIGKQRLVTEREARIFNEASEPHKADIHGIHLIDAGDFLAAIPGTLRYFVDMTAKVRDEALADIGRHKLENLADEFLQVLTVSDFWRAGAAQVLETAGLAGSISIEDVPSVLTQLLVEQVEPFCQDLKASIGDEVFAAAKCLSVSPSHEIAPHVFRYYLTAADTDVLARRHRAANNYPTYAGLIANVGVISRAVDAAEPISDLLTSALMCQERKKLFRKLHGEQNPLVRDMLTRGVLDIIQPDWIPQTDADWQAIADMERTWSQILMGDSHSAPPVWTPDLLVKSKGKFAEFLPMVVKSGADTRAPDGLGDEANTHFRAVLNIKPLPRNGDVVSEILHRTEASFEGLSEETLAGGGWPTEQAVASWLRRVCVQYGDRNEMHALGETLRTMVEAFSTRIILPTAMMAEKSIKIPVTRFLLREADIAATKILFSDKNFAAIAAMGRLFANQGASLVSALLSESEIRERREAESGNVLWRRMSMSREAMKWLEFFGIEGDAEEFPPLTYIQEFAPGLLAVPMFNRRQLLEEGDFSNRGALDRRGVSNLHHCIGSYHATEFITSGGLSQAFSVRRIVGNSYERVLTVGVHVAQENGNACLMMSQATGYCNRSMSALERQQVSDFLTKLRVEKLVNPKLIEFAMKKSKKTEKVAEVEVPLETIVGYSPFPVYKTATAFARWQASGLLPASMRTLDIREFGNVQNVLPVRQVIREGVVQRTGMKLDRHTHVNIPEIVPGAKPKTYHIKPGSNRMTGLFTGARVSSVDDGPGPS